MLALASMATSTTWGQGIIYVRPQPQPYYTLMTFFDINSDIDINGDGVADFTLLSTTISGLNCVYLVPLNGNLCVIFNGDVANMAIGDTVGPDMVSQYGWKDTQTLFSLIAWLEGFGNSISGNFDVQNDGYIGFDLVEGSDNYYGWMHIESMADVAIFGNVTEWAYSTVPNTPIIIGEIPEPTTIVLASMGLAAFILTRKSRKRNLQ